MGLGAITMTAFGQWSSMASREPNSLFDFVAAHLVQHEGIAEEGKDVLDPVTKHPIRPSASRDASRRFKPSTTCA
jgi:hypothetical protein